MANNHNMDCAGLKQDPAEAQSNQILLILLSLFICSYKLWIWIHVQYEQISVGSTENNLRKQNVKEFVKIFKFGAFYGHFKFQF